MQRDNARLTVRLTLLIALLMLAACAGSSNSNDPAQVVQDYLAAKVAGDNQTVQRLLCSSMESDLKREETSFSSIEARIQGMSCQRQGDTDVVTCTGKILAVYGTETSEFPLTSYQVVQEDGEWKWCGEAP